MAEGFRSLFIKRASKQVDPIIISWFNNLLPVVLFAPGLLFIQLRFNTGFWIGFLGTSIINLFAAIFYMRAISKGDISSVMPMMSFTPLFLLITSPIMVGEYPHAYGVLGIILIVTGSYLLNLNSRSKGILTPFKLLLNNKGTRYMFLVSLMWSISANFDKISIQNSSVAQHVILMNIFIFTGLTVIVGLQGKLKKKFYTTGKKNLLLVSLFTCGTYVFHMTALSMTLVAYVVALKRLSGLISVFLGHFALNEPNIRERLLGSIVMFIGVMFILFS
ncbi:MAG: hypothetical protein A2V66_07895 [Ignavibacteria bacterium RBG_13_36_8]|nr:MAG: hypothetical protein A2V66_07895 [Ignavibacteria bacterium RBG_13_36_8]